MTLTERQLKIDVDADPAMARKLVERVEGSLDAIARAVAGKMLELYDRAWRDDDEPLLDEDAFAARLSLDWLSIEADGTIFVYFADGDLFCGHAIEVALDPDGAVTSAHLIG